MAEEKSYFEMIGLKWQVKYPDFIKIITDYYKNEKELDINAAGPIILYDSVKKNGAMGPFYIINSELGLARFYIRKSELFKIFKAYYANTFSKEISDNIDFGKESVTFYGKLNYNIQNEMSEQDKKPVLSNIRYNSSLGYDQVRALITNYYEKVHNKRIVFIDVDYIISVLKDNKDDGIIHAETINKDEILIKKSEVADIIEDALNKKGFKSIKKSFEEQVLIEFVEKDSNITVKEEVKPTEPKKEEKANVIPKIEEKTVVKEDPKEEESTKDKIEATDALLILEGIRTEYEIRQRRRLHNEAQKRKTRSAILAGLCILGAMASIRFNKTDSDKILNDEINAINSWPALVEYVEDIGPLTTGLLAASGVFFASYVKNKKLVKKYRNQEADYYGAQEYVSRLGNED